SPAAHVRQTLDLAERCLALGERASEAVVALASAQVPGEQLGDIELQARHLYAALLDTLLTFLSTRENGCRLGGVDRAMHVALRLVRSGPAPATKLTSARQVFRGEFRPAPMD